MFQNAHILRFTLNCTIIGIFCLFFAFILNLTILKQHYFVGVYLSIPFIMLVTIFIHSFLVEVPKNDPKKFIFRFTVVSGFKMLLYIIVIFIYSFVIKRDIAIFVLSFFFLYVIYTITEISVILNYLKKN
jgi:hypothetical protein